MIEHYFQPDDTGAILANIARHGFAIVPELLDPLGQKAVREALAAHKTGLRGRNDFEGYRTERLYSLLARGRVFADMSEHPAILAVLDRMLAPNYLLSAALSIDLHPGESPQAIHFDDSFYAVPRPRPPIGMSVIWAIDPFTPENGATQLIPGSHTWGGDTPDGLPGVCRRVSRLSWAIPYTRHSWAMWTVCTRNGCCNHPGTRPSGIAN